MRIKLTIQGKQCSTKSKQFTRSGICYTPKEVKQWQKDVLTQIKLFAPESPLRGALGIAYTFYLKPPKSALKRKRPTVKPDWDNLCNATQDVLQGLFIENDSRIVEAHVYKHYADDYLTEIEIWEIEA